MTDAFDGNGDYSPYNDDDNEYSKQRKSGVGSNTVPHNGDNTNHVSSGGPGASGDSGQLNEKANEYIRDCLSEKNRMDRKFPIAEKLLECEIEKVQSTGRIPSREQKYADIYREKPIRVSQKVLVPIREHPKFNFVGKLLGPKGNSLRRLQEETLCKMTVLGRNSMRDRVKEEELRTSKDPKYAHLNSDLHVEISTIAPPAEAYARIAYAMAELRKYLIPDSNDIIRQEQLRELMDSTSINENDGGKSTFKKASHTQGTGGGIGMTMNTSTGASGSSNVLGGGNKNIPHHGYNRAPQQNQFSKNSVAPKQKVLSILEKARTAMDEGYGRSYDDHMPYETSYDSYSYGHAPPHTHPSQATGMNLPNMSTRGPYDTQEYDSDFNRRDYYQHSPNFGAGAGVSQTNQNTGLNPNHNRSHVNSIKCNYIQTTSGATTI
ncbi:KH domain-containing, RNA-binding, signal transduction-associated protein 3-like [Teleopsis dalmanni]|uniref:KH domain-containing, RNA-binding, signal transduction-associated protein 3-like n=1 Tax=Teleopsis dalmanni TaxID=139649 RepID=UPI0018CCC921|nr:KH domain-containing, RNA-binding, signal transduction-associated protein 3-like [Teleopsis dalmanni]XP_037948331.1 KH domain-containing, RNA-binding, signal transduction-associated protein 3-like [Teleopsis dalmanni]XP_037949056.1 KH domain-containing, RNA-binding, signal transduction-associated protein 3-like [Teleopsis dalmanni]XP_037949057.1 KH domain-containing, RNA-binding, signal transduction-associated protein 3-like [Teleopsis dalmanni]